jgi:hypothetical protein
MAHPLFHAKSSARKYGGKPDDYLAIHNWFDESKSYMGDVRHRALRHHAEGIFLCEKLFGVSITNSDGREVPVRFIGEQHVIEDLGRIPSVSDWLSEMPMKAWMGPRSQLEITVEDIKEENMESGKKSSKSAGKRLKK